MPSYHSTRYGVEHVRPRHHLDTPSWTAWPYEPDVVVKQGDILFKWTCNKVPRSKVPNSGHFGHSGESEMFEVTKLYSLDNGTTWHEDTYTTSYRWSGSPAKKPLEAKLDEALEIGKADDQRRRNRERARERAAELKEQAEAEGITVTELRERLKAERERENPHKVSKKDVEQLQRKIAVGGILKELQDEITHVMEKLDSDSIKITYVERYTSRLEEAVRVLKEWQK